MTCALPFFRYHPDPIATGAVEASPLACACCGRARGYVYALHVYCAAEVGRVCPWCIADGAAARMFDATFVDTRSLERVGIRDDVVREVAERTPGYLCWQSHDWMACCGDACEFHGDAPEEEMRRLDQDGLVRLSEASMFDVEDLRGMIATYVSGCSPAFYKFVCRHCGRVHYNADCD